jgi:hypothetical protein
MPAPKCVTDYDELRMVPVLGLLPSDVTLVSGLPDFPNGGIESLFEWRSQSSDHDNGGTVIQPRDPHALQNGRWHRVFEGAISVKWFGAVGGGRSLGSATITGGSHQLTLQSPQLTSRDKGKVIIVDGAGPRGPFCTLIVKYISGNQVDLEGFPVIPVTAVPIYCSTCADAHAKTGTIYSRRSSADSRPRPSLFSSRDRFSIGSRRDPGVAVLLPLLPTVIRALEVSARPECLLPAGLPPAVR